MPFFRNMSIKSKLSAIILLTSFVTLTLASTAFISNELFAFRNTMIADLFTIADVVGMNSSAGLLFNDAESAEENMAALKAKPPIILAYIFEEKGRKFASYFREDISPSQEITQITHLFKQNIQQDLTKNSYYFYENRVEIFKNIFFGDEKIGTIYILSDLSEMQNRLVWVGMTAVGVMLISLLVAFWIASVLQRIITTPIFNLLAAMQSVSKDEDYSLRAQKTTNDETGILIDGFNEMLAQIEIRDSELAQYRNHLEESVLQRTAELAEARDQALAANKAKSAFLANMSHELRTPLNGILGYTQILSRDKTLTPKQQEGIQIIQRSGDYLLTIINDILDLSKIEAGRVELYETDLHFSEFIQGIVDLFKMRAQQKSISFFYEPLSVMPKGIHVDEKRLRQILINLLGNAIKFTEKGGVSLKVVYQEGKMRFDIEDTGIGIASDEIERIFLPFQQVGEWTRKTEGTGLGLSITKNIIEMMGGELSVKSTLGQGSTFSVLLTVTEVSTLVKSRKAEEPIIVGFEGYPRKLLVVDDRWENRSVLVNLLSPLGFEMLEAENGKVGLEQAQQHRPDLILTDLVMPVMDGFEATRQIKKIPSLKEIPIIAASASVFDYHQQESIEAGCSDFIAKPIRAEILLDCLQKRLQLKWTYEQQEELTPTQSELVGMAEEGDSSHHVTGPSPTQAATLFDLGMMGDIKGILEEVDKLEQQDKRLTPFIQKIRQLAQNFEEEQICALVEQYMNS